MKRPELPSGRETIPQYPIYISTCPLDLDPEILRERLESMGEEFDPEEESKEDEEKR